MQRCLSPINDRALVPFSLDLASPSSPRRSRRRSRSCCRVAASTLGHHAFVLGVTDQRFDDVLSEINRLFPSQGQQAVELLELLHELFRTAGQQRDQLCAAIRAVRKDALVCLRAFLTGGSAAGYGACCSARSQPLPRCLIEPTTCGRGCDSTRDFFVRGFELLNRNCEQGVAAAARQWETVFDRWFAPLNQRAAQCLSCIREDSG